ncbi:MAG: hypothetical protein WA871_14020, partial [Candidatus Acidiferrales bacterium]
MNDWEANGAEAATHERSYVGTRAPGAQRRTAKLQSCWKQSQAIGGLREEAADQGGVGYAAYCEDVGSGAEMGAVAARGLMNFHEGAAD